MVCLILVKNRRFNSDFVDDIPDYLQMGKVVAGLAELVSRLFADRDLQTVNKIVSCVMKSHNGMRPHDVVILLKILINKDLGWTYRDLAASLYLSTSEISESLNRSHMGGLVDENKRIVYRQTLMDFIQYGLHSVFPALPGTIVTGIPTAHSYPFYSQQFASEINYVWPDEEGTIRGLSIPPLYKSVVKAVKSDELLYKLLASLDIIRVGKTRELQVALTVLTQTIL